MFQRRNHQNVCDAAFINMTKPRLNDQIPQHPFRSRNEKIYKLWHFQYELFRNAFKTNELEYNGFKTHSSSIHYARPREMVVAYHFVKGKTRFWVAMGGYQSVIMTVGTTRPKMARQYGIRQLSNEVINEISQVSAKVAAHKYIRQIAL